MAHPGPETDIVVPCNDGPSHAHARFLHQRMEVLASELEVTPLWRWGERRRAKARLDEAVQEWNALYGR